MNIENKNIYAEKLLKCCVSLLKNSKKSFPNIQERMKLLIKNNK